MLSVFMHLVLSAVLINEHNKFVLGFSFHSYLSMIIATRHGMGRMERWKVGGRVLQQGNLFCFSHMHFSGVSEEVSGNNNWKWSNTAKPSKQRMSTFLDGKKYTRSIPTILQRFTNYKLQMAFNAPHFLGPWNTAHTVTVSCNVDIWKEQIIWNGELFAQHLL